MLRREPSENPFDVRPQAPPVEELPPGYRLKRIGPADWVAEPFSVRRRLVVAVVLACLISSAVSIQLMRVYYARKASRVMVAVNGEPIRRDAFLVEMERRHGQTVMQDLVARALARQFARSKGAWPSEKQVARRFAAEKARPGFEEELIKAGLTEEDYKDRLRYRLAEVNLITRGIKATEAEVRYFYERNVDPRNPSAVFRTPETAQVAVIVTKTREEAERAQRELIRHVPWTDVVVRFSIHESRTAAGLLAPLQRGRSVFSSDAKAEQRIFALREGDRSEPFPALGRWWIVRCIRKWPARVVPFQEAREDAEMGARIEKGAARNADALAQERAEFLSGADIFVADPYYESVSRPVIGRR